MGMDPWLRVGTGMGDMEKWRWLLRMGTNGTQIKHQHPLQYPFHLLDIPSQQVYVSPQHAPVL